MENNKNFWRIDYVDNLDYFEFPTLNKSKNFCKTLYESAEKRKKKLDGEFIFHYKNNEAVSRVEIRVNEDGTCKFGKTEKVPSLFDLFVEWSKNKGNNILLDPNKDSSLATGMDAVD